MSRCETPYWTTTLIKKARRAFPLALTLALVVPACAKDDTETAVVARPVTVTADGGFSQFPLQGETKLADTKRYCTELGGIATQAGDVVRCELKKGSVDVPVSNEGSDYEALVQICKFAGGSTGVTSAQETGQVVEVCEMSPAN